MIKGNHIKEMARKFKLLHPHKDIFRIIKERNIVICPLDESISTSGAFLNLTNTTCIFINTKIEDYDELRMLYTHELAHTLLHRDMNTLELRNNLSYYVEKLEKEANLFTAEFLLDDDIFEKYHGESFENIAKIERVSLELVNLKYDNLNNTNINYICD